MRALVKLSLLMMLCSIPVWGQGASEGIAKIEQVRSKALYIESPERYIGTEGWKRYDQKYRVRPVVTPVPNHDPAWIEILVTADPEGQRFTKENRRIGFAGWTSLSLVDPNEKPVEPEGDWDYDTLSCKIAPNGKYALTGSFRQFNHYAIKRHDGTTVVTLDTTNTLMMYSITTDTQCLLVDDQHDSKRLLLLDPSGKIIDSFTPEYSQECEIMQQPSDPAKLFVWTRDNVSLVTVTPSKLKVEWTYAAFQDFEKDRIVADNYKLWDMHDGYLSPGWKYFYLLANRRKMIPDGAIIYPREIMLGGNGTPAWSAFRSDLHDTVPGPHDKQPANEAFWLFAPNSFVGFWDDDSFGRVDVTPQGKPIVSDAGDVYLDIYACKDGTPLKSYKVHAPDLKNFKYGGLKLIERRFEVFFSNGRKEAVTEVYRLE